MPRISVKNFRRGQTYKSILYLHHKKNGLKLKKTGLKNYYIILKIIQNYKFNATYELYKNKKNYNFLYVRKVCVKITFTLP
jgi:hypothetical protein